MKDREETIQHDMQYCQHYRPEGVTMIGGKEPDGICGAGVNYLEQFGSATKEDKNSYICGKYYPSAGIFGRICCTDGGKRSKEEQLASCSKWEQRTREMGEKRADDIEKMLNDHTILAPILSEWRKKKPIGKEEVIECPVCKNRLHLSQASCNGHVWGRCETEDCFNWME